MYTGYSLRFV